MPALCGADNPNWRGGMLQKVCEVCSAPFQVKPASRSARFCSLQCVGASQRGKGKSRGRTVQKACQNCGELFIVFASHAERQACCSKDCSFQQRSLRNKGSSNPSWAGGLSRSPYPWNFKDLSKSVIRRDGRCFGIDCRGVDKRLTAHHIDYDKSNSAPDNLIALCSSCNTRANFRRDSWMAAYRSLMVERKLSEAI